MALPDTQAQVHITEQQAAKAISLADRLKLAMHMAGIKNPNQLAKAADVKRQTAYYWLDGTTKSIDSPTLRQLSEVLGVRAEWLIDGELPVYSVLVPEPDEIQIIEFYRRMMPADQVVFMKMARTLAGDSTSPATKGDPFPRAPKGR